MKRVAVLGATGSIGRQALDVIARLPDELTVRSLAARSDVEAIAEQGRAHPDAILALVEPGAAQALRDLLPGRVVLEGAEALEAMATDGEADVVLNAVVGAAGLRATLAALDAGRTVALANKESCVAGGPLVARRLAEGRGRIVPVDSEHAATHMCLAGERFDDVRQLVLTASGGPFRGRSREELETVGIDDALAHPTWTMGAKITVDSATLMNKGLEVIEAHVLFGFAYDRIEVVVHPQSVLHCVVEFADGSWKSSLGPPDMRVPIAYALGWPERPEWGAEPVDWSAMRDLTFEPVDVQTFACLRLAYEAGRTGGAAPAVLNAANEVAVAAFLDGRIGFLGIAEAVERVLEAGAKRDLGYGATSLDIEAILAADAWARHETLRV